MAVVSAPAGYEFICTLQELPKRGRKIICIGKTAVLLIVTDSGLYALEDRCPTTTRSLSHSKVLNDQLTSPSGAHYDLRTGQYTGGGALPLSHWLPKLDVMVVADRVFVRLPKERLKRK